MNLKTFNTKESLLYGLPIFLGGLAIHFGVFEFMVNHFRFNDPSDLVLCRPRSLYFLVVAYILAVLIVPTKVYERGISWREHFVKVVLQCAVTIGIMAISINVLFHSFAGFFLLYDGLLSIAGIAVFQFLCQWAISIARKKGRNKIHTVIVGENHNSERLEELFQKDFADYKLVACFGNDLPAIKSYLSSNKVHQLYCCLPSSSETETVNALIRTCEDLFIDFYYVPELEGLLRHSVSLGEIGSIPVLKLREEPLSNPVNIAYKRLTDIVISFLFLVTLFPVIFIFVAIGTSLSSPGPIFFKQKRTGNKGRPFIMYKFRSMKVNADADKLQATEADPRKTKFGDFLRRTSIDELPQFINVFKGDMSVIGPRPHMELHTEMYAKLVDEYLVRHMVKPGITGWAQVNGCRGCTPTTESMEQRVRYDIWYVEHWSAFLDVRIFFMTVAQILKGDENAY